MIKAAEAVQAYTVGSVHYFLWPMRDQGQDDSMKTSCFKRQKLIGECHVVVSFENGKIWTLHVQDSASAS